MGHFKKKILIDVWLVQTIHRSFQIHSGLFQWRDWKFTISLQKRNRLSQGRSMQIPKIVCTSLNVVYHKAFFCFLFSLHFYWSIRYLISIIYNYLEGLTGENIFVHWLDLVKFSDFVRPTFWAKKFWQFWGQNDRFVLILLTTTGCLEMRRS